MPLDLRIIDNFFSDLHFAFIYFIIQNALIKIYIQSSASAALITIRDTIIISNAQISLVPESNLNLYCTILTVNLSERELLLERVKTRKTLCRAQDRQALLYLHRALTALC